MKRKNAKGGRRKAARRRARKTAEIAVPVVEQPIPRAFTGEAEVFEQDSGRQPLASGGARRGEALQVAEEEDDFEDGRSSAGRFTRSQEDQWARGDVGSRAVETPTGVLGVERHGESPTLRRLKRRGKKNNPQNA